MTTILQCDHCQAQTAVCGGVAPKGWTGCHDPRRSFRALTRDFCSAAHEVAWRKHLDEFGRDLVSGRFSVDLGLDLDDLIASDGSDQ